MHHNDNGVGGKRRPRGSKDGRSRRRRRDGRGPRVALPGRSRHARGRGRASESRERQPRRLEDRASFIVRGDSARRRPRPAGARDGRGDAPRQGTRRRLRDDPARRRLHDLRAARDAGHPRGQRRARSASRPDRGCRGDGGRRRDARVARRRVHLARRPGLQRGMGARSRSQRARPVRTQRARRRRPSRRVRRGGAPSRQGAPSGDDAGRAGPTRRRHLDAAGGGVRRRRHQRRRRRHGRRARRRLSRVAAVDTMRGSPRRTRRTKKRALRTFGRRRDRAPHSCV